MSKAFTRESDESGKDDIFASRPQLPAGARNYITREGAEQIKQELNVLLEKKREATSNTNELMPDAARQRLESVIRKLQQTLDSVVVAETPVDRDKVAFGAIVLVRNGNGEEESYQIVGIEEADPGRGRISWISPLARALLSKKPGDKVHFRTPAGDEQLTIVTVRY